MPLTVASIVPRDGRACADCGATEGLSIQHRANKGMGGSKAAERKSNGVILCATFNALLEQDAYEAGRARRMGWKLSKWDDPTKVPYWHAPTQTWWLADDAGGREPAPGPLIRDHLARWRTED